MFNFNLDVLNFDFVNLAESKKFVSVEEVRRMKLLLYLVQVAVCSVTLALKPPSNKKSRAKNAKKLKKQNRAIQESKDKDDQTAKGVTKDGYLNLDVTDVHIIPLGDHAKTARADDTTSCDMRRGILDDVVQMVKGKKGSQPSYEVNLFGLLHHDIIADLREDQWKAVRIKQPIRESWKFQILIDVKDELGRIIRARAATQFQKPDKKELPSCLRVFNCLTIDAARVFIVNQITSKQLPTPEKKDHLICLNPPFRKTVANFQAHDIGILDLNAAKLELFEFSFVGDNHVFLNCQQYDEKKHSRKLKNRKFRLDTIEIEYEKNTTDEISYVYADIVNRLNLDVSDTKQKVDIDTVLKDELKQMVGKYKVVDQELTFKKGTVVEHNWFEQRHGVEWFLNKDMFENYEDFIGNYRNYEVMNENFSIEWLQEKLKKCNVNLHVRSMARWVFNFKLLPRENNTDASDLPLHLASSLGDIDSMSYLMSIGADPTVKDCFGKSAFQHACDNGKKDVFETLWLPEKEQIAQMWCTKILENKPVSEFNESCRMIEDKCAKTGGLEGIEIIKEVVNFRTFIPEAKAREICNQRLTVLGWAYALALPDIPVPGGLVAFLLSKGGNMAHIHLKPETASLSLLYDTCRGWATLVKRRAQRKNSNCSDVSELVQNEKMLTAVETNPKLVDYTTSMDLVIDSINGLRDDKFSKNNPIYLAISNGDVEALQFFFEKGGDHIIFKEKVIVLTFLDVISNRWCRILNETENEEKLSTVLNDFKDALLTFQLCLPKVRGKEMMLCQDSLNFSIKNNPLLLAVEKSNVTAVNFFLDAGADPNLQNSDGTTALDISTKIDADSSGTNVKVSISQKAIKSALESAGAKKGEHFTPGEYNFSKNNSSAGKRMREADDLRTILQSKLKQAKFVAAGLKKQVDNPYQYHELSRKTVVNRWKTVRDEVTDLTNQILEVCAAASGSESSRPQFQASELSPMTTISNSCAVSNIPGVGATGQGSATGSHDIGVHVPKVTKADIQLLQGGQEDDDLEFDLDGENDHFENLLKPVSTNCFPQPPAVTGNEQIANDVVQEIDVVPPPRQFLLGDLVTIQGLKSKPELNGMAGDNALRIINDTLPPHGSQKLKKKVKMTCPCFLGRGAKVGGFDSKKFTLSRQSLVTSLCFNTTRLLEKYLETRSEISTIREDDGASEDGSPKQSEYRQPSVEQLINVLARELDNNLDNSNGVNQAAQWFFVVLRKWISIRSNIWQEEFYVLSDGANDLARQNKLTTVPQTEINEDIDTLHPDKIQMVRRISNFSMLLNSVRAEFFEKGNSMGYIDKGQLYRRMNTNELAKLSCWKEMKIHRTYPLSWLEHSANNRKVAGSSPSKKIKSRMSFWGKKSVVDKKTTGVKKTVVVKASPTHKGSA
eukprot:gene808-420_t